MAEASGFWTTGGTVGDQQASYTQAHWSTASRILSACRGFEGVAPGYLNALAGTATGANTVAINTGGALVDGKWFVNDASQDVNIPSASGGGNTRIDRIVLRATWASFNVSVTRIAGTDAASPTAPSITQTSGTTYDILLYQALVDTAGTVTVTDEREFGSDLYYRQGGDASSWMVYGTTNYAMASAGVQCGVARWTGTAASGAVTITFPRAFANIPVVLASVVLPDSSSTNLGCNVEYDTATASSCVVNWKNLYDTGTFSTVYISWIAIGDR